MSATNKKKASSPLDQTDRDLKKPHIDLNITEQSDSEESSIIVDIDPTPPAQATPPQEQDSHGSAQVTADDNQSRDTHD